ncbi:Tfa2p [Sugiyamaella lignohabitans]|uniref:Transcription initiation factor IIE subunit beta n=1 Tax=Sugiyamaella lignohabitans TaxID=796027 RepID=A0A167FTW9_9ASCO|nr:Tfa2p [Sugiyamaella lignohabitans]ANB15698.1 Tfa2p [Sugiyamaella lignohabitans]
MSSLNDQLNSFRSKVRNAPTVAKPVISDAAAARKRAASSLVAKANPSLNDDKSDLSDTSPAKKQKRSIVNYAQAANSGIGNHQSTQLVHAVEYIKRHDQPVKWKDIERYLSFPIEPLLKLMRNIDRIKIDDENQTASYVSEYNIYSADDLLSFLRAQKTFQGIQVKKLKDGWNGCLDAIDKLEKSEDIVVLRMKKENGPKYIWANTGGTIGGIDPAFTELWKKVKVPTASELPGLLEKAGLKPASVDPATVKKTNTPEKDRKQKKPRRGKITNTHLRGVLKDYSSI